MPERTTQSRRNAILEKVFKGSSLFIAGEYLTGAAGFFIRIILARRMTIEEFGLFYAVIASLGVVGLLKNMGFNRALVKFIPEFLVKRDYTSLKQAIIMTSLFSVLTSSFAIMVTMFFLEEISIHYFHAPMAQRILPILLLYFFISTLNTVIASVFHGFKLPLYLELRQFLGSALVLVGLLFLTELELVALCWVYVATEVVVFTACLVGLFRTFQLFKYRGWISIKVFKKMAWFALPSTSTTIASKTTGRMDNILLTYFQGVTDVGFYNVASPFGRLFISLGSAIGKMMFPYSAELIAQKRGDDLNAVVHQIHRQLILIMVPLGVFLILHTSYVLTLIFGAQYLKSVSASQLLIFGGLIHAISLININIINGLGYPLKVTKIVLISGIINTAGCLILIPIWNFVGAALAITISYLSTVILSLYSLKDVSAFRVRWKDPIKVFMAGALVYAVGRLYLILFPSMNLPLFIVSFFLLMTLYMVICLLARITTIGELTGIARGIIRTFSRKLARS